MDSQSCAQRGCEDAFVSGLAKRDEVPWYRKSNLRRLYLLMFPTCFGVEMTTGFDVSMMNSLQAVPSWLEYFHHPHSALLGLMVAAYSLGFAAAVPIASFVVDKSGRRYSIVLGSLMTIIGSIIQGSALNATTFIIARFVLGFGTVFGVIAAASLVAELSHPNERPAMCCLFVGPFDLGAIVATVVILGTFSMTSDWGWRLPSLLQAFPSLFQLSFIWLLPESPRWLISKGRGKEAYAILVKYHAEGNENSEFVKAEYTQIKGTLELEQNITNTTWKEAFSTPGMRKRIVLAIFLGISTSWSGIGLILYFFSPILDTIGIHDYQTKIVVNLARVTWSFVVGTTFALIVPRYPRRRVFLASAISLLLVLVAWTVASAEYSLSHSKVSAQVVLILIFLYIPAFNLGFTVTICPFMVELFPFHVRSRGLSIFQWCARFSGFVSQILNPIGIDVAGWRWYTVYCVWNVLLVVFVYVMVPETSGRTLEELASLYEGDQQIPGPGEVERLLEDREGGADYGTRRRNLHDLRV